MGDGMGDRSSDAEIHPDSEVTYDNHPCRKSESKIKRAADHTVPDSVRERIKRGIPANTSRAYGKVWERFEIWCDLADRTSLPATALTLSIYVDHLCELGRSPSTIEHAIAVVRTKHRLAGYRGQPGTEEVRTMLRGYKKDWSDAGNEVRRAAAAVVESIHAMVATCDVATLRGLRDRAVIVLGFALMGRRSELSRLNISDVTEIEHGLKVRIRYSKTDQEAVGVTVTVPYGEHLQTCPVLCTLAWVAALERRGITSGPLFWAIDRFGKVGNERAGRRAERLSGHTINKIVQTAATAAGLSDVSAHSLRAGGATSAAANGKPSAAIAEHGRWDPKSRQLFEYLRASDKLDDNPMKGIGL